MYPAKYPVVTDRQEASVANLEISPTNRIPLIHTDLSRENKDYEEVHRIHRPLDSAHT